MESLQEIEKLLTERIKNDLLKDPGCQIGADEPLISSGRIDSLSLVDLALLVEEDFGVHLDDSELNTDYFDTIHQLAELIQSRK